IFFTSLCLIFTFVVSASNDKSSYIVVLKSTYDVKNTANDVAKNNNGTVRHMYKKVLNGFSIELPEQALNGIKNDKRVDYIEPNIKMSIVAAQPITTGLKRIFANTSDLMIDGSDTLPVDVDVAVLDTGIDTEHPDLNVVSGTNCLYYTGKGPRRRVYNCDSSLGGDDDHYHGTHVAGTIGAIDNSFGVVGVAPGARLWAVKVLDSQGSGSMAGIIAGIDWVVEQGEVEVINMSLGGTGTSSAMNTAIANAVASGVTVVVAAGNSGMDSSGFTPANSPGAITVSALADFDGLPGSLGSPTCRPDVDDTLADFSNWGAIVDIAAPGVCIYSTYPLERGSYESISGTSMAAPHVAGAAALLASKGTSDIANILTSNGNFDWVDDSGDGVKEPLLDISNAVFKPTFVDPSVNNPPTASFTFNCTLLSCDFDGSDSTDDNGIVSYQWDFGYIPEGESDNASGSGMNINHSFPDDGIYTVMLTVDDGEATNSLNLDVLVDSVVPVEELSGFAVNNGSRWTATVTSNLPLSGSWSVNANDSCSGNSCTLSGIRKKVSSVTFTSDTGVEITILKP
ncbi:S8 family serine peptidase, partial [Vibrio makurazakiensis]|uniref:S8 family serine peptidase n=1 Tax=Vibrio makurazakiensis TaxID=2910250 RepID=UPI003D0BA7F7